MIKGILSQHAYKGGLWHTVRIAVCRSSSLELRALFLFCEHDEHRKTTFSLFFESGMHLISALHKTTLQSR